MSAISRDIFLVWPIEGYILSVENSGFKFWGLFDVKVRGRVTGWVWDRVGLELGLGLGLG